MTDAEQKEYDAAYQAEIDKLDAAAAANATTTDADNTDPAPEAKDALKTEPAAEQQGEPETTEARFLRLEAELASTSKALKDTKTWATKNAAEVKRLRKEQDERERAANRPQVLDDNPGLEEAIRHVSGARPASAPENAQQTWADTVATALPELDALLEQNPELQTKAKALAQTWGTTGTIRSLLFASWAGCNATTSAPSLRRPLKKLRGGTSSKKDRKRRQCKCLPDPQRARPPSPTRSKRWKT